MIMIMMIIIMMLLLIIGLPSPVAPPPYGAVRPDSETYANDNLHTN